MNSMVSRFAYRSLLRLHPAPFQDEFGAEMLWIFDEERQEGGVGHLLVDGAISLLRQRCRLRHDPGQLSITSGTIVSLIQFLSHPNVFTVSVRWSDRMPCYTLTLQAPSHAEVVLKPTS
jgi:hypothetical protein